MSGCNERNAGVLTFRNNKYCRVFSSVIFMLFPVSKVSAFSFTRYSKILTAPVFRRANHVPRRETTMRAMSSQFSSVSNAINTSNQLSSRINETLDPCVVLMKALISKYEELWTERGGIVSLAQGVVYWNPPPTCYDAISKVLSADSNNLHTYAPESGIPDLVSALELKLVRENGLDDVSVMVTAGANQAYTNCVLTLLDEGNDQGVVFAPYYFNHVMAMQMSRGSESVLVGPTTADGMPDTQWLTDELEAQNNSIKMVTVVNPGNPTGVSMPSENLKEISDLCARHGVWLVMDNTYEHFDHIGANSPSESDQTGTPFPCVNEDHIIHIFSFSKGYSMAGFRVGYLTVSKRGKGVECFKQMLKVQDTVPICVSRISQTAALGALDAGRDWVIEKVSTLSIGRDAILKALSPLETIIGGSGAMYVMGKLPGEVDDEKVSELLVKKFGVATIPGSFCGFPGWIRVCYSNLSPNQCQAAAKRLGDGITSIVRDSNVLSELDRN